MKVTRWHLLIVVLFLLLGVVTVVSIFPYTLQLSSNLAAKTESLSPANHIVNLTSPPSGHLAKVTKQDVPARRVAKAAERGAETAVSSIAPTLKHADLLIRVLATPDHYPYDTTSYVVQAGDTLYRIARHFGTTVAALAKLNDIANPSLIYVGQYLSIPTYSYPTTYHEPTEHQYHTSQHVVQYGDTLYAIARYYGATVAAIVHANNLPNSYHIRPGQVLLIPDSSYVHHYPPAPPAPTAPEAQPTLSADRACTRFNFLVGRNRYHGSRAGTYEMNEVTGKLLATWRAREGDVDSGWLSNLNISFESVHVIVTFYPADGGAPVNMEIVNPAGGTSYGWLTRNLCHAIEIQYPHYY